MEALAAVSLAGNILQFVDSTKKLISTARNFSVFGAKKENLELEGLAQELQHFARRVSPSEVPQAVTLSEEDEALKSLESQCLDITTELLGVLDSLKLKGDYNKWHSFHQALRSEWKKPEIDALQARLDRIFQHVSNYLLAANHQKLYSQIDQLQQENHYLDASRAKDIEELRSQFQSIFKDVREELRKNAPRENTSILLLRAGEQAQQYSAEQMVLEKLRFDVMDERHISISDVHEKTFEWIFSDTPTSSQALSGYVEWLTSQDALYWISGKPGSGKSTLMKHLCTHEKTHSGLQTWAQGFRLITANFFFWNAGKNHLQRDQQGLLRSLIYQILRQCPEIIPHTYPELWHSHELSQDFVIDNNPAISTPNLVSKLQDIAVHFSSSDTRFCFFIDGLDEYEGKPEDLIELIHVFTSLPNVKICASSRPWNEFEQAYGHDLSRKLYMQDFNTEDIRIYVNAKFHGTIGYQELADKNLAEELIQEIIHAAQGVFLWVILVVRSFQEGLINGDRISDLQRRLRTLPTDLDEYFKKILFTDVDDFYREGAAEMFRLALHANEIMPVMAYWFIDNETDALELEIGTLEDDKLTQRTKQMRKRLNACCKGLIEVKSTSSSTALEKWDEFVNLQVDFLHRTVRDFLKTTEIHNLLQRWSRGKFNADLKISQAMLAVIKIAPECPVGGQDTMARFISTLLYHVDELRDDPQFEDLEVRTIIQLRDVVESQPAALHSKLWDSIDPTRLLFKFPKMPIIGVCFLHRLRRYIRYVVDQDASSNEDLNLYLEMALRVIDPSLVSLFLRKGADPNAKHYKKATNWCFFVQDRLGMVLEGEYRTDHTASTEEDCYLIAKEMLDHGADPRLTVSLHSGRPEQKAKDVLQSALTPEHFRLLEHHFADVDQEPSQAQGTPDSNQRQAKGRAKRFLHKATNSLRRLRQRERNL